MNITLCSAFRNAEKYQDRYFNQVEQLADVLRDRNDSLWCVWGEGDSTDKTLRQLCMGLALNRIDGGIVDCTHSGPTFESIEHPQRFRQLAHVGNKILSAIPADADVVLWLKVT